MHEDSEPGGDSQKQDRIVQASTLLFTLRAPHVPESEGEGLKEMDDCGTRHIIFIRVRHIQVKHSHNSLT